MPPIHTLDLHFQDLPGTIASYLIEGPDGLVLIETGPGSTLPTLLSEIKRVGFDPDDITDVLLTHIHLDHAGAAGWWAQQGATVHVHPKGARHIIDPSRLIDSAAMIYGDRMDTLWGEMLPAPEDSVNSVEDNQQVQAGGLDFIAWDTPGHARHHLCWILDDTAFTGDAAGVRLSGTHHISLPSAPPQFEPEIYVNTLRRIAQGDFSTIYPTHFGVVTDVSEYLARCEEIVLGSAELVRAHLRNGLGRDAIEERYRAYCHDRALADLLSEKDWAALEATNSVSMCVDGILLYWKRDAS